MTKKKKASKGIDLLSDYFSEFNNWPSKWAEGDEDLEIGKSIVLLFALFIKSMIESGLAIKTVNNHNTLPKPLLRRGRGRLLFKRI